MTTLPINRKPGRRVLIVSPHFPPVNAPDMQRVRMSLPYFREFGWEPYVLAVAPGSVDSLDPLLGETIPMDVCVERVRSIPPEISRYVGIGNVALRALPFLYRAGCRIISTERVDLVYFSTTMFLAMPLGRVWKRQFGTPYVLDIQDPWASDYYETHPEAEPPPKYSLARRLHAILEPWTMKEVGAIVAVSPAYVATLRQRYARLTESMCTVLPFAASSADFELLDNHPQPNPFFQPGSGHWHGTYTGAVGDFMAPALRVLFAALRAGLRSDAVRFDRVRLHFIGTSYAPPDRARKLVEPLAEQFELALYVEEQTRRAPYFQALQVMKDADFLILLGSDDESYAASKLHTYFHARKPVVAIVHADSRMVGRLKDAGALVVTFSSDPASEEIAAAHLVQGWKRLLDSLPRVPAGSPTESDDDSARTATKQQCDVFDGVLARGVSPRSADSQFAQCAN
jgi:hypothetical protein